MDGKSGRAQNDRMRAFVLLMILVSVAACSPAKQNASQPVAHKTASAKPADTGHTPRPVAQIPDEDLFHGWKCAWDCSAHQAGYAWAAEHKIVNPQDCQRGSERSESFIEGCWAYTGAEGPFGQKEIFQDED